MTKGQFRFCVDLTKEAILMLADGVCDQVHEYIEDSRFGYLIFVDNWHKHPVMSKMMCKMGRHDYEFESVGNGGWGVLYCFYCEKKKSSHSHKKNWFNTDVSNDNL